RVARLFKPHLEGPARRGPVKSQTGGNDKHVATCLTSRRFERSLSPVSLRNTVLAGTSIDDRPRRLHMKSRWLAPLGGLAIVTALVSVAAVQLAGQTPAKANTTPAKNYTAPR